MPDHVLVAVAWPYVNGDPHLGHIAGNTLPADIFARYHRMAGNHVLMVSGSDMHGTPTMLRARREGKSAREIAEGYHEVFVDMNERMGFSFDLYTHTDTRNHHEVAQWVFKTLYDRGHMEEGTIQMPFSVTEQRFLSDRFVEGTCPICGYDRARGDQCDGCGNTLDPADLINIRSIMDGSTPEFRDTTHIYFKLSAFQDALMEWVEQQEQWRSNVRNFTLGMLRQGLHDRAITRDIDWGVPVPLEGYDDKRIYVWFEAVCGYLSASIEWARSGRNPSGDPEAWRQWWQNPEARSYYFQGKDNIPFHTIIWPAMLTGVSGDDAHFNLPYDVPASEYLNLEGRKFSTSQNWAVWLPDYLDRYDTDPLRYYLTAIMPETSDSDFTWSGYLSRNNDELVATFGNFVHRVLTLTHRNFGEIPSPGELDEEDRAALAACDEALENVGAQIAARRFRDGLRGVMALAQHGNRYLDQRAPWQQVKTDRAAAGTTLWTAFNIVSTLRTVSYPYIPFSSEKLHEMLGAQGGPLDTGWKRLEIVPGEPVNSPSPLFKKLDEGIVDEEMERLKQAAESA